MSIISRGRLGQACVKLRETDDHISSICFDVGCRILAGFHRRSPKIKAVTPRAYRNKARRGRTRRRTAR